MASTSGHRQRDHDAGAPAERQEADERARWRAPRAKERSNSRMACSTTRGWSAICSMSMPCGTAAMNSSVAAADVLAEVEDVGALRHDDADAERRLAALAHEIVGRILEAARHGGDVAEAEGAPVRLDRRLGDGLRAVERAGDAQAECAARRSRPCRPGPPRSAAAANRRGPAAECPRVASLAWLNSTKIFSSCTP